MAGRAITRLASNQRRPHGAHRTRDRALRSSKDALGRGVGAMPLLHESARGVLRRLMRGTNRAE